MGWAWLTAAAFAVQTVLLRAVVRTASPSDVFVLMGVMAGLAASGVLVFRAVRGRILWGMPAHETGLLVAAELIGLVAIMAYYVALKHVGVARTYGATVSYPVLAVLIVWVALHEPPTTWQIVGLVVAGIGVAMVHAGS